MATTVADDDIIEDGEDDSDGIITPSGVVAAKPYARLISFLGGRKFLIAVMIIAISATALFKGYMDQDTFRSIVVWVLGLYGGANIGQRVGAMLADSRQAAAEATTKKKIVK